MVNKMVLTICNWISHNCFELLRDWKLDYLANGKEIAAIPFWTGKEEISKRMFWKITVPFDFLLKFPGLFFPNTF